MLTYNFEKNLIPLCLAHSKPHDLAVIDTEGCEDAVKSAVKRGVFVYGYLNAGALEKERPYYQQFKHLRLAPHVDGTEIGEQRQSDSTNPYMMWDRVTYNGKTYESTINNNVWSPDVYRWTEVE